MVNSRTYAADRKDTMKNFKWAFVGDLQIPYEDKRAVALWFKVMKSWKPDAIDIVGDIDDQLEYSKYSDGTTDEFMSQLKTKERDFEKSLAAYEKELDGGNTLLVPPSLDLSPIPMIKANADGAKCFYTAVRKQHPNANIHSSLGNHDIRIFGYIDRKAPQYNEEVTPNMLWGLDDLGITWRMYHEKPFLRFADTYVHHGNTTSTTGPTIRKDIDDYGVSLVRGHSHKAMIAYKTYPMLDKILHGMETGHMCDPTAYGLQYAGNPDWQLGFGLAQITPEGKIQLEFIPIHNDYTCIVDGKLFAG